MAAAAAARDGLVIVGGCYAALQAAAAARAAGHTGPIRMLGEEACAPYQRPPLSKGFLTGRVDAEALPIRGAAFYAENAIDLVTGCRVVAIDRHGRAVQAADGRRFGYDRLVLATGSRPRRLPAEMPGAGLEGVLVLRTLPDALALRALLPDVGEAAVIGGGFIGLEVAAALSALGRRVTVLEAQPRLLARAATPPLAAQVAALHRRHGVALRLGTTARRFEADATGRRVAAVQASDGTRIPAQLVIIGIGVAPRVALAEAAGLACPDGIAVDACGRTADPAILAAGECALHPNPFAEGGRAIRLESVQHAQDHGRCVGAAAAGRPEPYAAVPWFWSDQHDWKIQMVGLAQGADRHVLRGDPDAGRFSVVHFRAGAPVAIDSVNRAAEHVLGRKLLAARAMFTPEQAADPGFDLASLLPPARAAR